MTAPIRSRETTDAARTPLRTRTGTVGWIVLLLLAAFPVFGSLADLASDAGGTIPTDHQAAFRALTGSTVAAAQTGAPGLLRYVHTLEIGYALHELVFAILLLALVAVPLRRRQPWAWAACAAVLIADIGYAATFGAYDTTILQQSLLAAAGTVLALLLLCPSVFRTRRRGRPAAGEPDQ